MDTPNVRPKIKVVKKETFGIDRSPSKAATKAKGTRAKKGKDTSYAAKFKLTTDFTSKSRTTHLPFISPASSLSRSNTNIVTLKLTRADVKELEMHLGHAGNILLDGILNPLNPGSWDPEAMNNPIYKSCDGVPSVTAETMTPMAPMSPMTPMIPVPIPRPGKTVVPIMAKDSEERKNLIINSGIKRNVSQVLGQNGDAWPLYSPYACYYCSHTFETTPVGIPYAIINDVFMCYGNFCSYNCAKRYLCPKHDDDDDMACIQTYCDVYVGDEQGEKLQLLELLYHIECDIPIDQSIKPAPKRLVLKLFGGSKSIEEYRSSFNTNTTFHVFKTPIASMGYQIEECNDTRNDSKRTLRKFSLDVEKLEKAKKELLKVKSINRN